MCFGGGGGGPSQEEKQVSVDQSLEADAAKRESAEDLASQKREDISEALEARRTSEGRGGGGGRGRRSLFRSGGSGAGFIGRFGR
jgi:hypothetical protein